MQTYGMHGSLSELKTLLHAEAVPYRPGILHGEQLFAVQQLLQVGKLTCSHDLAAPMQADGRSAHLRRSFALETGVVCQLVQLLHSCRHRRWHLRMHNATLNRKPGWLWVGLRKAIAAAGRCNAQGMEAAKPSPCHA